MFIHCKFMFHKQRIFTILCCMWLECSIIVYAYNCLKDAASVAAVKYILLCRFANENERKSERRSSSLIKCWILTNLRWHFFCGGKAEMRWKRNFFFISSWEIYFHWESASKSLTLIFLMESSCIIIIRNAGMINNLISHSENCCHNELNNSIINML